MKRIALCLHGYFSSLKDKSSLGDDGYKHIKKHILSHESNDCKIDVFCHSWEPELDAHIKKLYDPVTLYSEKQIDFVEIAKKHNVNIEKLDPQNRLPREYGRPDRILSHFYSVQKVMKLRKEHEDKNGFKYDCVIKSRFDLGRINRKYTGPGQKNYPVQCINFDPNLDMKFLYQAYWNLFNEGPADMWFYSSSENMDHFCHLYTKVLEEYLQIGSDYSKAVKNGWRDSKINDFRSNEILKPLDKRAKNLHRYPSHMVVNAILLYKWFFQENNLWETAKALRTEWE